MNESLHLCGRLSPEINHLIKIDKNNKFKLAAAAILNFIYRL